MSNEKNLEENLKEIEAIIEKIEKGVTLEESTKLYKEGIALLEKCSNKIDTIEKELIILKEDNRMLKND